jgi:hypothetical protein
MEEPVPTAEHQSAEELHSFQLVPLAVLPIHLDTSEK